MKQKYSTNLRSRTLASIEPEISLALSSPIDELNTIEDAHAMRTVNRFKSDPKLKYSQSKKSCPICKETYRSSNHFLSEHRYLPESDRRYMTKVRQLEAFHNENESGNEKDNMSTTQRIQVEQSTYIDVFHNHQPIRVTLDSVATGNMIQRSAAVLLGAEIIKTKWSASQADSLSRLKVIGETNLYIEREEHKFKFDGLVVKDLDVDVLGGMPFMKCYDIQIRPSKNLITIGGQYNYCYSNQSHD